MAKSKAVPQPLNTKFDNRVGKKEAVEKFLQRKRTSVELYPSEKSQEELQAVASTVVNVTSGSKTKRAAPTCKACKKPRKGHPKGPCPFV
eukprot:gene13080-14423_t